MPADLSHWRFPPWHLPREVSHIFLAIDPQLFGGPDEFKARMDNLIKMIKSQPLADGQLPYLPGEKGPAERARRQSEGISLLPAILRHLQEVGSELGVSLPHAT